MPINGLTPISKGKTKHGYQMPIYLDLFQSPQDDHRNTNANNMDLQLHPHIQQTNKSTKQRGHKWPMKWSYTLSLPNHRNNGQLMDLQLSSMGKPKMDQKDMKW